MADSVTRPVTGAVWLGRLPDGFVSVGFMRVELMSFARLTLVLYISVREYEVVLNRTFRSLLPHLQPFS